MSIEDNFDQDDLEHYGQKTAECGEKVPIVGDDILVPNPTVRFSTFESIPTLFDRKLIYTLKLCLQRVKKAIEEKTCYALLLKVNQIGSMTEGIEAVMSKHAGWGVMVSHHRYNKVTNRK